MTATHNQHVVFSKLQSGHHRYEPIPYIIESIVPTVLLTTSQATTTTMQSAV